MKNSRVALLVLLCVLLIAGAGILSADEAKPDVTPVISRPGALVFKDDFGKEKIGPEWKPLHGTCWKIVEGTLKGEPSTKEYQQTQIAKHYPVYEEKLAEKEGDLMKTLAAMKLQKKNEELQERIEKLEKLVRGMTAANPSVGDGPKG